ncbi:MAG: hypothetical protein U0942_15765 [Parvibaculum sp.]|uniref:hypothetical protein n=1 Tax=Parvibaculum sp. TaxID=2024848 RepID=UPI002AB852F7|nr:hypothetical protein [Parvibaculum sp.]MDZ4382788.1 hypothetical protein [Parvibaculum sp.]
MNITYTIADFRSDDVSAGLSARDAAIDLLGHDGAEWEIRDNGETGFDLWHRKPNAGKPWTMTAIYSIEGDRDAAESEIFEKVIASGYWDRDDMFSGTDEQYQQMLADGEE